MKGNEDVKRKQSFFDYEMESRLSVQGHDEEVQVVGDMNFRNEHQRIFSNTYNIEKIKEKEKEESTYKTEMTPVKSRKDDYSTVDETLKAKKSKPQKKVDDIIFSDVERVKLNGDFPLYNNNKVLKAYISSNNESPSKEIVKDEAHNDKNAKMSRKDEKNTKSQTNKTTCISQANKPSENENLPENKIENPNLGNASESKEKNKRTKKKCCYIY